MEHKKKPAAAPRSPGSILPTPVAFLGKRAPAPLQRKVKAPETAPIAENCTQQLSSALQTHTVRPAQLQRQMAAPALNAAHLHALESQRLETARPVLQREVQALTQTLPPSAVRHALQRRLEDAAPLPVVRKPQSNADWVTVMRQQSAQIEGRLVRTQENEQFKALQRQVAQRLAVGTARTDERPS